MTLQQFIDFDEYVRCICVGKEFILPIRYDPRRRCYLDQEGYLSAAVETQVLDGAWALNHALGYDMNSVEFAIKDGVAYAIDFTNPAPDMDVHSILPKHFAMVVEAMAKLAVDCVKEGRRTTTASPSGEYMRRLPGGRPRATARDSPRAAPSSQPARGRQSPTVAPTQSRPAVLIHPEHLPARQPDQVDDGLECRRGRRPDHHHPHLGLHLGARRASRIAGA